MNLTLMIPCPLLTCGGENATLNTFKVWTLTAAQKHFLLPTVAHCWFTLSDIVCWFTLAVTRGSERPFQDNFTGPKLRDLYRHWITSRWHCCVCRGPWWHNATFNDRVTARRPSVIYVLMFEVDQTIHTVLHILRVGLWIWAPYACEFCSSKGLRLYKDTYFLPSEAFKQGWAPHHPSPHLL